MQQTVDGVHIFVISSLEVVFAGSEIISICFKPSVSILWPIKPSKINKIFVLHALQLYFLLPNKIIKYLARHLSVCTACVFYTKVFRITSRRYIGFFNLPFTIGFFIIAAI